MLGAESCPDLPSGLAVKLYRERKIRYGWVASAVGQIPQGHDWAYNFVGKLLSNSSESFGGAAIWGNHLRLRSTRWLYSVSFKVLLDRAVLVILIPCTSSMMQAISARCYYVEA